MSCCFFPYIFRMKAPALFLSSPHEWPYVSLFLFGEGLFLRCISQADLYLLGTSIHLHLPQLGLQVSITMLILSLTSKASLGFICGG